MVTARAVGRLSTLAELAVAAAARRRRPGRLEGPPRRRRGGRARRARRRARRWRRRAGASRSAALRRRAREPPPPPAAARSGRRRTGAAAAARDGEEAPVRRANVALATAERRAKVAARWEPSTRSRTRRAGSARRPPRSTSPPASPRAGRQMLLVDLDPQCNATVALGLDRDASPVLVRVPVRRDLGRRRGAPGRARTTSGSCPANRDLAGASVELPRVEGFERRLRDGLGPVRERFALTLLDCPPSLGPGDRQRAGRGRPGDRPGPGRVPGARGAGPVPRDARPGPPRAQPGAGSDRRADHDARRANPTRPRRRARAARAPTRTGVRYSDTHAASGVAEAPELRHPGDRARPGLARRGRLPRARRRARRARGRRSAR